MTWQHPYGVKKKALLWDESTSALLGDKDSVFSEFSQAHMLPVELDIVVRWDLSPHFSVLLYLSNAFFNINFFFPHQESCSSQPVCESRAYQSGRVSSSKRCYVSTYQVFFLFVSFPKSKTQQWWGSRKREIETEAEECGVKNPQIRLSLTFSVWLLGENKRDKEGQEGSELRDGERETVEEEKNCQRCHYIGVHLALVSEILSNTKFKGAVPTPPPTPSYLPGWFYQSPLSKFCVPSYIYPLSNQYDVPLNRTL